MSPMKDEQTREMRSNTTALWELEPAATRTPVLMVDHSQTADFPISQV